MFIQFIFLIINNSFVILYFLFSCGCIFDFQLWHIMFIINRCVTNNTQQRYPPIEIVVEKLLLLWSSHNMSTHKCKFLNFL